MGVKSTTRAVILNAEQPELGHAKLASGDLQVPKHLLWSSWPAACASQNPQADQANQRGDADKWDVDEQELPADLVFPGDDCCQGAQHDSQGNSQRQAHRGSQQSEQ